MVSQYALAITTVSITAQQIHIRSELSLYYRLLPNYFLL